MGAGLHIPAFQSAADLPANTALPVESWNPPFCGDIDMQIKQDGAWFYNGTPILRLPMVQLFSRILRKDGGAYFLVTPVEKVGITVEDVPFIAVEMGHDTVTAGAEHPLRFQADNDTFKPYVEVRNGLYARLSRTLAQDLAGLSEVGQHQGSEWFGITTSGIFFPVMPAGSILDR